MNKLTKRVQINTLSKYTLQKAYYKLDNYIYDSASFQIAQNIIDSATFIKQYKYNNLAAQIAKDTHAGWYNFIAITRKSFNKILIKSYEKDLTSLKNIQDIGIKHILIIRKIYIDE